MEWPLAVLIFALVFLAAFYKPITKLFDRVSSAGKDGVRFSGPQESQQPVGPTFVDLMRLPVMPSVTQREPSIKAQFETFHLETEEQKVTTLIRALASVRIESEFYRAATYIFGSQLELLAKLAGSNSGIAIEDAKTLFDNAKTGFPDAHSERSFESWAAFLQNNGFIAFEATRIELTTLGADFLKFLVDQRLAYKRAA